MQPPPRKVKAATNLRNIHNEQITKLQTKHQQDLDLLEDIRNFMKSRANIEKEYGQALVKLANSFLQRKIPAASEMNNGNNCQQKTVYTIWKTLLDEIVKVAQAKQAAVDVYQEVSDKAKMLRSNKLHISKKCFDDIRKMHEELQQSAQEADKAKKLYTEEQHMAHEAGEKLKKKKGKFFQTFSSSQKNNLKLSSKKDACDIQATKARNDYILSLVATNAHLSRFYEVDLKDLMQNLDCNIYDKIKEYVQLVCQSELLTCATWQSSFSYLQSEAESVTKNYTMDCFLNDNPVLSKLIQYSFDPCDGDTVTKISTENNASLCLSKEARKWASCIAKENRTLRECYEELGRLQCEAIGKEKSSVSLIGERTGTEIDPEAKIEELHQMIRKTEIGKAKAEARIEALREGEVNVDEWLKSADVESQGPQDNLSRTGSRSSRSSQRSSRSEVYDEATSEANESFYDSDFNDDMSDTSVQSQTMMSTSAVDTTVPDSQRNEEAVIDTGEEASEENLVYPARNGQNVGYQYETSKQEAESSPTLNIRCSALFTYEAANPDELNFVEHEELWIVGEGDGDGWVKARNYRNEEGYIPQNYVEIADEQDFISSIQPAPASFSSVDYMSESLSSPPDNTQIEGITDNVAPFEEPDNCLPSLPGGGFCQALFDYEAMCDEELSFTEGQIIRISKKVVHDVDDGWWEGEIDGRSGIFPSLVVKEIKPDEESQTPSDVDTPTDSIPPPNFTPPKPQLLLPPAQVILTQPTPETDTTDAGTISKASSPGLESYAPLVSSPDSCVVLNEGLESFQNSFEAITQELQKPLQQPAIVEEYVIENQGIDQLESSRIEDNIPPLEQDDTIESTSDHYIVELQSSKTKEDNPPAEQNDPIESASDQVESQVQHFTTEENNPLINQNYHTYSTNDQEVSQEQSSRTEVDVSTIEQNGCIDSTADQDVSQEPSSRLEKDVFPIGQDYHIGSTDDQDVSQYHSSMTEEDFISVQQCDHVNCTTDQDVTQEQSSRTEEDILPPIRQDEAVDSTTDEDIGQEKSFMIEEDSIPVQQFDHVNCTTDQDVSQEQISRTEEDISSIEQDDCIDSTTDQDVSQEQSSRTKEDVCLAEQDDPMDSTTVVNRNIRNADNEVQEYKSESFLQDGGAPCQVTSELTNTVENN
ncbi:F-BAR and double SH3 domains protein 2-like isoform X2 [Tachypleus tridentatus]|uniref:F-BAR and double SH3 domains protein 2-like isoform X2 n=1 Tax=Tachypleus tridentatus TaxID=6853 RepID=UPI003FD6751C